MIPSDFRFFIVRELQRRQEKNTSYSQAALARDLKMSAQKLSQIIKGIHGISSKVAQEISDNLHLSAFEKEMFLALVAAKHARSPILRRNAEEKILKLQASEEYQNISDQDFENISHWSHWAAYMLVDVEDFSQDPHWLSKRLGLPAQKAMDVYDDLFKAGLLKKDNGRWSRTSKKFSFRAEKSFQSLRTLYGDLLENAKQCIEKEKITNRHYSFSMMALDAENYQRIKNKVEQFSHELVNELATMDYTPDRVYTVGLQLFPMDQKNDER